MIKQVLIAHAEGEEHLAEVLAGPITEAGYEVTHRDTILVGDSILEEASKILQIGGALVICGTVTAIGTGWAHLLVQAARQHQRARIFVVQMEKNAYVQALSHDEKVALYWQDPARAAKELITALKKHYPLDEADARAKHHRTAEQRYRDLALHSCDIIDLANLPENDRHVATRQLELRRLYVALRVRVELPLGMDAADADLEALEKRRLMQLRSLAGWTTGEMAPALDVNKRVSVGERLAVAKRLVVLGDPGAGKTTLIRWIATAYLLRLKNDPDWNALPDVGTLPDANWLPIIVRCRDLDQNCLTGTLDDILGHTLRRAEMSDAECKALQTVLIDKLRAGEALLLLDGLDEITDPGVRVRFCRQLEQIHLAYPNAPMIA
ncbi:MAG: hypothetical protein JOZ51_15975, partial [Chloroflexi bacterium]|nr:hypothetical protein [Chloroflexota bacterium]